MDQADTPPKSNPLFDRWDPIWKAKEALDASSYSATQVGTSKKGAPKFHVTFMRGKKQIATLLGVELVSKAGRRYMSVNMGVQPPDKAYDLGNDAIYQATQPRPVIKPTYGLGDLYL